MTEQTAMTTTSAGGKAIAEALTAKDLRERINRIQEVMGAVMKDGTHYGQIPGTNQKSLYKAGSETLLVTFHVTVEPDIEDLSDGDHVRYRVRAVGIHQGTGMTIGVGVGEASSEEEKYCWRDAVCNEEWVDAEPERRRIKWQKPKGGGNAYQRQQIRTNAADVANTILKMAKKRAQIDLTLTALGASDIFTQDIEDLPDELNHLRPGADQGGKPATSQPQSKSQSANQAKGGQQNKSQQTKKASGTATEKQVGFMRRKMAEAHVDEAAMLEHFKIDKLEAMPFEKVNEAIEYIDSNSVPY